MYTKDFSQLKHINQVKKESCNPYHICIIQGLPKVNSEATTRLTIDHDGTFGGHHTDLGLCSTLVQSCITRRWLLDNKVVDIAITHEFNPIGGLNRRVVKEPLHLERKKIDMMFDYRK